MQKITNLIKYVDKWQVFICETYNGTGKMGQKNWALP